MKRTARDNRERQPKPVQRVEVSEKHIKFRVIALIVAIVVAVTAIGFGVYSALKKDKGMTAITVTATLRNCGDEFLFYYNVGYGKTSATAEYRALTSIYSQLCVDAYRIFDEYEVYDDIVSVDYINSHPNERITVNETLYNAFSKMLECAGRYIYYSMVYDYYSSIFYADSDLEASNFDPYLSDEIEDYYKEICAYADSAENINLSLYDDYSVELCVSEQFLKFADESASRKFLSFSWFKNAFIIDYLADELIKRGYTDGYITSYDGYTRTLSERNMNLKIYDRDESYIYDVCNLSMDVGSIVVLRNFPVGLPRNYYYLYENGDIRTRYIDKFGLSLNNNTTFASYAKANCSDILMAIYLIWASPSVDNDKVVSLTADGINSVYVKDRTVYYTEDNLKIDNLLSDERITYKKALL